MILNNKKSVSLELETFIFPLQDSRVRTESPKRKRL